MVPLTSDVFVSTSCLKGRFGSLNDLLQIYIDSAIRRIELGPVSGCESFEISPSFIKGDIKYLVHNYFPPPEKPFVLNLASRDDGLHARSLALCMNAIDLCAELGAPYYSVHAGFRSDISPDSLGDIIRYEEVVTYESAFRTFVESLEVLDAHAKKRGVSLLVEPNVISVFNLRMGRNDIALICESEEILNLIELLGSDNVGILLDTGHLNVTAKTLGFDRFKFAADIAQYVRAIHLHDNDGSRDSHEPVKPDSWVFDLLSIRELNGLPITLEAKFGNMGDLRRHVEWVGEAIKRIQR